MRSIALTLPCLLALCACGNDTPPARKERIADPEARGDVLPVMGLERKITVLATGLIDGSGLEKAETYASRLEYALRARGINARVGAVASLEGARKSPGELVVVPDSTLASALAADGARAIAPRMTVPAALVRADGVHPDARGVEELVAQSADQVAAALPALR